MVKTLKLRSLVTVVALMFAWSCQVPTQPTADTVPMTLTARVRDQAGNTLPMSGLTLKRDTTGVIVAPSSYDRAASTWTYSLTVPVTGERYTAIAGAPPSAAFTTFQPFFDTATLRVPCRDTSIAFEFSRRDSVPCGTLSLDETLDFGTICVDRDTTISLTTADIVHGCPAGATITSVTAPSIAGLNVETLLRRPDQNVQAATFWAMSRPLAVRATFSTAGKATPSFDGNDIVVDASPNVRITVHLKGRAISCVSCNCPKFDTVSFGLALAGGRIIDTNELSLVDPPRSTTIDLRSITNASECDLLFTRTKDFSSDELRTTSINGSQNTSAVTLASRASMTSMDVLFTPRRTGEVTDTTVYHVQKRAKDGSLSDCDSVLIIYHGHVGQGICTIDTAATNASSRSYLKNDTITNCINSDEDFRYLCIKNTGDGTLKTTLPFAVNDPRFYILNEATGNKYQGEDVVIPKDGRFCFSIHFIPNAVGPLASDKFTACETLPIYGRVKNPCINCLDGGLRQYQVTPTSFQGFTADSNTFVFVSDQNTRLAIYAQNVSATSVTFTTMLTTTFSLVQSNYTLSSPLITLCDDKNAIALGKAQTCGVGPSTITVGVHDLLLFSPVPGKCGLLYIDNIHNSNGIMVVDFQATYPIN